MIDGARQSHVVLSVEHLMRAMCVSPHPNHLECSLCRGQVGGNPEAADDSQMPIQLLVHVLAYLLP